MFYDGLKHWNLNNFFLLTHVLLEISSGGRDVIDSRQIDRSTFSLCQLNRIERLGIESK